MRNLIQRLIPAGVPALVIVLAGCTTNPVTGQRQLDLIGQSQEIEMGKQLYPQAIQTSWGSIDDAALQGEVERVGRSVASVSQRPDLPFDFTAVNDPQVNAFALPGGKICITRGLVARLQSEDALAAVLGHEVGHVAARHVVNEYNHQLLMQGLLMGAGIYMQSKQLPGAEQQALGLGAQIAAGAVMARFSRDQERQADQLGLQYAVKAGYSPRGMIQTQQVLVGLQQGQPGLVQRMFASHPMSSERLATARNEVAKLPPDVQNRPVRTDSFQSAAAEEIRQRPAWDKAADGLTAMAANDAGAAERDFADAVRRLPSSGVLRTMHAVALYDAKNENAAVAEASEGARLSPDVFLTGFVAGQVLLRPDPQGALQALNQADRVLPGVAQVSFLEGQALERLGQTQQAAAAYQTTVQRDPNGQVGQQAAQRLQQLGYGNGAYGSSPQQP